MNKSTVSKTVEPSWPFVSQPGQPNVSCICHLKPQGDRSNSGPDTEEIARAGTVTEDSKSDQTEHSWLHGDCLIAAYKHTYLTIELKIRS